MRVTLKQEFYFYNSDIRCSIFPKLHHVLVQNSPDTLLVGLIMGPNVVHLALGNNTQVNVAPRAQVVKNACSNGVSHQLLGLLLL